MTRPFYDDGRGIQIFLGDCREILPTLGTVDLVLTDPPYGMGLRTDYASKGRSTTNACITSYVGRDYAPIHGDDAPFDPSHLLGYEKVVLFGANYFADRLPVVGSWWVWDKLDGLTSKREVGFNDNADAELIWTNLGGPVRIYRHRWMGLLKASEQQDRRVHPTQKPVSLMSAIIAQHTAIGEIVLDPYTGSGPVLRAAKDLGRRAIGIEIHEPYAELAAQRLSQEVLAL